MNHLIRITSLAFILGLSGCAAFQSSSAQEPLQQDGAQNTATETPEEYGNFSDNDDTLYDLLVAEVAAQRSQFDITLVNYIQQARATKDQGVILRAINAAQLIKDNEAVKELGLIWLEQEPDNISAHQLLAYQYSLEKSYPDAMSHISSIIELEGQTSVEALAISSQTVSEQEKQELLLLYTDLLAQFPDKWEVRYSLALVQRNVKQCDKAITNLEQVIKEQPDFQQAYVVKANCLLESNDKIKALEFAEYSYERFPENHALGRLYASLLIEVSRIEDAEIVFAELLEYYPDSPSLVLSHALLMLENGKIEEARSAFNGLIELKAHENEAHFYLARIAEVEKDQEAAIAEYQLVGPSSHYYDAIERSSFILTQLDRTDEATAHLDMLRQTNPNDALRLWLLQYRLFATINAQEEAIETLDNALAEFPDDEQLLYARAMHRDASGDLAGMEADLRHILEINPGNAVAMNALGYTLADKTDRYEEAIKLISTALSLKPDNPAIMDSMGWVLFKVGKIEESLKILSVAYQNYPDGEVGAHLGEVLWTSGNKDDAVKVWAVSLQKQPDHPILLATIQRLAPELLQPRTEQTEQDTPASNTDEQTSNSEQTEPFSNPDTEASEAAAN